MQKAAALFLILFFGFSVVLFAQDDSEPEVEPDWETYTSDLYTRGDQIISLSLGVGFPLYPDEFTANIIPTIGGTGALNYLYYLSSKFFTGGEISLLFLPTIGGNTVFITSFGARLGTQLILGKFEFPLYMSLGMSVHTYLDKGYFGYYMKAGTGVFFRATNEWSFGVTSNFCWYPEWIDDPAINKNIDALFIDVSLTARYHF